MRKLRVITMAIVLSLLPGMLLSSQEGKPAAGHKAVDLNGFIKELMHLQLQGNQQTVAIWLPAEFFIEAAATEQDHEQAEKTFAFLKKYIVIAVLQQQEDEDGVKSFARKSDVAKRASLKMANAEEFKLMDDLPPKVADLLENAKRSFNNNGAFGKNAHMLIFSATTDGWKTSFDTSKRNTLILSLAGGNGYTKTQLVWKTPFDSTQPVPPCRKCGEPLSSKWSYCPWCGAKMESR